MHSADSLAICLGDLITHMHRHLMELMDGLV